MAECLVCSGSRKIRLPLRYPASVLAGDDIGFEPISQPSYKEFACPECAPAVTEDKVAVLEFNATVASIEAPGYEAAMRRQAAHVLVDAILQKGFIKFRKGPADDLNMRYDIFGRVGIVSTAVVASMEERIAERQTEVAKEVVERAAEKISVWGSHYTGLEGRISKEQAIDSVREAAKRVFKNRAERDRSWRNA